MDTMGNDDGVTNVFLSDFVKGTYNKVLSEGADERIVGWPLCENELVVIGLCLFYVIFVCWIGPYLMKGRQPFKLHRAMTIYNLFQVVFSGYIFTLSIRGGWLNGYNLSCQPTERHPSPRGQTMVAMMWWYYISKYVDFIDTIFILLRKNYKQISFLHVAHHGAMPFGSWYLMKFVSGGNVTMLPFLNSFMHTLMYSYYFLSAMGPTVQQYLWWKKYLTTLQMIQFVIVTAHAAQLFFVDCPDVPKYPAAWVSFFCAWIFILFLQFFLKSYKTISAGSRRSNSTKG